MTSDVSAEGDAWRSDLQGFMAPTSVALIGASEASRVSRGVVAAMQRLEYPGELFMVNPNRKTAFGSVCYPNIRDLPSSPDCAVVAVARTATIPVLNDCIAQSVDHVAILSSGFAETGRLENIAIERELRELADEHRIRVIGPNCNGVVSLPGRAAIGFALLPEGIRSGTVAVLSQSGGLLNAIVELGTVRGLGFSRLISGGNESVIDCCDALEYLIGDPETKVIAVLVEAFKNGRRFAALARAAMAAGKPVILLKLGRSERGRAAVLTHTASLAGDYRVTRDVLQTAGVVLVDSIDELVDNSCAFAHGTIPRAGTAAFILTISGGGAALSADMADRVDLTLAELSKPSRQELDRIFRGTDRIENPFDCAFDLQVLRDPSIFSSCLALLLDDDNVGSLVLVGKRNGSTGLQGLLRCMQSTQLPPDKPVLSISTISRDSIATENGVGGAVILLEDLERGLGVVKNLHTFSDVRAGASPDSVDDIIDRDHQAEEAILSYSRAGRSVLTEREATAVLRMLGIPATRDMPAASATDAVAAAVAIGYPVAVKVDSEHVVHKSDVHGVVLGVGDDDGVRSAFDRVTAAIPPGTPRRVLVQQMMPQGVEVLIGTVRTPEFGPVILIGSGGALPGSGEGQTALRLAPIDRGKARSALRATGIGALLETRFDGAVIGRLCDIIVAVADLAARSIEHIESIDINPLTLDQSTGTIAMLDATILLTAPVERSP